MSATIGPPARQTFAYKVVDGHVIEADVMGAEPGQRKPCVLWIHGGGLIFGSRTISPRATFARILVDRGFVVVSIDHRLAPEARLPVILEDVADAWHWLHRIGGESIGVDTSCVAIAGVSAGAYLSLLNGYMLEPRPLAVASFCGYGDITAPWEARPSAHYRTMDLVTREEAFAALATPSEASASSVDRSTFYLYCRQQGLWLQEVTGHDPQKDDAWLGQYCPIRNIDHTYPPTVLVHGTADSDVPHEESEKLVARLAAVGVAHRFISLPGVGHGFAGAELESVMAAESAVADFLASELRHFSYLSARRASIRAG